MELTAHSSVAAERSVAAIMGQVLTLVAAAIGLCALGSYLGRDLAFSTARIFSFAALGMLAVQWFVSATRYGALGIFWLAAIAALLGYGVGPVMTYYLDTSPSTVTSAAVLTFATVLAMGAIGFALSKDTVRWMRPLSFVVLGCAAVTIVGMMFGGLGSTLSPVISGIVVVFSALLILVDFNYVRKHATEDDVVWLATGIFVSIFNIFFSLLNIMRN
jgi:modulator of FtsH protease